MKKDFFSGKITLLTFKSDDNSVFRKERQYKLGTGILAFDMKTALIGG